MKYDKQTALVVVDMQNDFADPKGNLYVQDGETIIHFINGEIQKAICDEAQVVYTRDWHPETTPHFAKDGGLWPTHCVHDTWGADYHPDLRQPSEYDWEVYKGKGNTDGFSAFEATDLAGMLNRAGINTVVIIGLATDYCVGATALSAADLGFITTVLDEGILAVNLEPQDDAKMVFRMMEKGIVVA